MYKIVVKDHETGKEIELIEETVISGTTQFYYHDNNENYLTQTIGPQNPLPAQSIFRGQGLRLGDLTVEVILKEEVN